MAMQSPSKSFRTLSTMRPPLEGRRLKRYDECLAHSVEKRGRRIVLVVSYAVLSSPCSLDRVCSPVVDCHRGKISSSNVDQIGRSMKGLCGGIARAHGVLRSSACSKLL